MGLDINPVIGLSIPKVAESRPFRGSGRLARSVMSSGVTLGAGSASPQAKPALPGSCGPVVPAFSDGIQMMNSAIAANWHVAAAQT
jgi:hypothetical protein